MKKIRIMDILVDTMDYPNIGIGKYEDKQIRCKGAITGQKIRVKKGKSRKNYAEGKLIEVLERSPLEQNTPCPAFGECGGCFYQRLSYQDELSVKESMLRKLLNLSNTDIEIEVHPNPSPSGYRNKMEYTFGDEYKGGPLVLGLHSKGKYYEMVDTSGCNIVHSDFEVIRIAVQEFFRKCGLPFYRRLDRTGALRHLVLRYGFHTGEIMVNLVTTSQHEIDSGEFVKLLTSLKTEAKIVSILHCINDSPADAVKADEIKLLYGRDHFYEKVLDLEFKISPFSFFQPNVFGIENLYSEVLKLAGDVKDKTVFDLYSGTGTIGMILAKTAGHVIGVEIVEEAVAAARENAEANGLKNVEFKASDVLDELESLDENAELIVIDPPRAGIHPKVLEGIIEHSPKKLIYVSCNPKSMAEDLKAFIESGYVVESASLFDQFTRTPHMETVVLLAKLDVDKHIDIKTEMDEFDITATEGKALN